MSCCHWCLIRSELAGLIQQAEVRAEPAEAERLREQMRLLAELGRERFDALLEIIEDYKRG